MMTFLLIWLVGGVAATWMAAACAPDVWKDAPPLCRWAFFAFGLPILALTLGRIILRPLLNPKETVHLFDSRRKSV